MQTILSIQHKSCGSGLAREGNRSVDIELAEPPLSRASPLPPGDSGLPGLFAIPRCAPCVRDHVRSGAPVAAPATMTRAAQSTAHKSA
ncbi:hypothetical protein E3Z29_14565 [Pseudomonas sp. S150]|nr:hypothetical protein E3Z29_14565 [Pseudomonas sp. S150]